MAEILKYANQHKVIHNHVDPEDGVRFKGLKPCLPWELTTVQEVVHKQCSHMHRGRNTCFNLCPCSSCGRPIFQLGFFAQSF